MRFGRVRLLKKNFSFTQSRIGNIITLTTWWREPRRWHSMTIVICQSPTIVTSRGENEILWWTSHYSLSSDIFLGGSKSKIIFCSSFGPGKICYIDSAVLEGRVSFGEKSVLFIAAKWWVSNSTWIRLRYCIAC